VTETFSFAEGDGPSETASDRAMETPFATGFRHWDGQGVPVDKEKARAIFEEAAAKGCPNSMVALALILAPSQGLTADWRRTHELANEAAAKGYPNGIWLKGYIAKCGWGCDPDPAAAKRWFNLAIKLGSRNAMYDLADLLEGEGRLACINGDVLDLYKGAAGLGHEEARKRLDRFYENPFADFDMCARLPEGAKISMPDDDRPFDWQWVSPGSSTPDRRTPAPEFPPPPSGDECTDEQYLTWRLAAAEAGDVESQAWLGRHYRWSDAPDHERSQHWLERAAEGGDAATQALLGFDFMGGITRPQDREQGLKWLHMSAHGGHAPAQYALGWEYLGEEFGRDVLTAIYWLEKAVEQEHPYAMTLLGHCYVAGLSDWFSPTDGASLLVRAAEMGEAEAQAEIGFMHRVGRILPKDPELALKWSRAAAEQGNGEGMFELAQLHAEGFGVEASVEEHVHWLELAAEAGKGEAAHYLGLRYLTGDGVDRDPARAMVLIDQAANSGHLFAMWKLVELYKVGDVIPADEASAAEWARRARLGASHVPQRSQAGTILKADFLRVRPNPPQYAF